MSVNIGHVVVGSAVLALSSFVYIVGFAPMDESVNPRAGAINRVPSRGGMISNIRRMIATGQLASANRVADQLVEHNPEDPSAFFWRASVDDRLGDADSAINHWAILDALLEGISGWPERYSSLELDYFRAWGRRGIGDIEESQAMFAKLADDLEATGSGRGAEYNLSCYRAMSGDLDSAIEHWERAIEFGYGRDGGWWSVDPDLESLHSDERFWLAGSEIIQVRLENQLGTENRSDP